MQWDPPRGFGRLRGIGGSGGAAAAGAAKVGKGEVRGLKRWLHKKIDKFLDVFDDFRTLGRSDAWTLRRPDARTSGHSDALVSGRLDVRTPAPLFFIFCGRRGEGPKPDRAVTSQAAPALAAAAAKIAKSERKKGTNA